MNQKLVDTMEMAAAAIRDNQDLLVTLTPKLLEICTDLTIPIEKRWDLWKRLAVKEDEPYLIDEKDSPLCRSWVDGRVDYNERYRTFTYEDIIEYARELCGEYRDDDWNRNAIQEIADKAGITPNDVTVDAFKEELMRNNLGSFVLDW
jgi:hypothetical protein